MKRILVALLLVLVSGSRALSQVARNSSSDQTAARVGAIFARWNKPDSPGCALAVIKDGRIVYKRGYGMANLGNTIYRFLPHLCSMPDRFQSSSPR